MISIKDFQRKFSAREPITLVTGYDYTMARIISASTVDAILVGDSAAMVMHGYDTTINATVDMMAAHVTAVRRGAGDKLVIADLPFLAHRHGRRRLMLAVDAMMKAGAGAVKIEGGRAQVDSIRYVIESGIPVMGHLGLTPQSVHQLGGYKVQGRGQAAEQVLLNDAGLLAEAGCFAIVLEMVPAPLAKQATGQSSIPTIGIGAGPHTAGQVLVLQDLLGMNPEFRPKFLRTYLDGFNLIREALDRFTADVQAGEFPGPEESFH
ncbi:MAG: 3-methyl-2-oxobutanoate hydroxymethyltransferase [Candidatus Neomarinimicrobiota bacterium]